MLHMRQKKRFIAGAVCQACGLVDCLVSWDEQKENIRYLECVSCGYADKQRLGKPAELLTRVNSAHLISNDHLKLLKIINLDDSKTDA